MKLQCGCTRFPELEMRDRVRVLHRWRVSCRVTSGTGPRGEGFAGVYNTYILHGPVSPALPGLQELCTRALGNMERWRRAIMG